jgi:radical SAM protein with 4Fe4S-binding SPASM domain
LRIIKGLGIRIMEWPHIPEIKYGEFSEHIHSRVFAEQIPSDGTIELTHRCNLKCIHCYCNLPANDRKVREKELTTKEVFRILDEIAEEGCLWLLLTGGEPLLREDFKEIYAYAKRKGMLITLFTNGTLISQEIADLLRDCPPFLVSITIYGATPKTYEKITRVSRSFSRCLRGINLLLERKIPLRLRTIAMRMNYAELRAMKSFSESCGLEFRFDSCIHPRLDGSLSPCNARLSPEEVVRLDLEDERRVSKFKKSYYEFEASSTTNFLYNCSAGVDTFSINPYGHLQICLMVTKPFFNLREGSFNHGWKKFIPEIRSLPKKRQSQCDSCRNRPLCARCPAWADLEAGNPEAPVEYLCKIASLRKEAFGLK